MEGEGVLHECLLHPEVESVLVINRKPCGVKHEKLKEIIHRDFFDLSTIEEQLKGYIACYYGTNKPKPPNHLFIRLAFFQNPLSEAAFLILIFYFQSLVE